mgnify:CR=1 FL=1
MKLNKSLKNSHASYISNLYTIDCRLGTNPYGHPELNSDISADILQNLNEYYDFSWIAKLSIQTAKYINCDPECVFFGNGSMPILSTLFNKLLDSQSKRMIGIGPQFVDAISEWKLSGGEYLAVHDSDELISSIINTKPDVVYIDNPNNPSGKVYPKQELQAIKLACRETATLLIVDEAYGDYLNMSESMIGDTQTSDNIIVVRSFSKGLGMAGIRLGYAVVPKSLCGYLTRITIPFTPSIPSIKIACSALESAKQFMSQSIAQTQATKSRMIAAFKECGIVALNSDKRTPIFMVYMEGKNAAAWFEDKGILVESCHHFKETCKSMSREYARVRIVGNNYDLEHLLYRLKA